MHKYKVINFSGVPYGKPDEMQKGREQYIVRQLLKTDDICIIEKLDTKIILKTKTDSVF